MLVDFAVRHRRELSQFIAGLLFEKIGIGKYRTPSVSLYWIQSYQVAAMKQFTKCNLGFPKANRKLKRHMHCYPLKCGWGKKYFISFLLFLILSLKNSTKALGNSISKWRQTKNSCKLYLWTLTWRKHSFPKHFPSFDIEFLNFVTVIRRYLTRKWQSLWILCNYTHIWNVQ